MLDDTQTSPSAYQLGAMATMPSLLICCDYDGTLSPIVDDPWAARPLPEGVAALRALASLPQTHVAVISGRALRDLAAMSRLPHEVHLVGSHGSEFDVGFSRSLPGEAHALLSRLSGAAHEIARDTPGSVVEEKPASVAFHVRQATPEAGAAALDRLIRGPAQWSGVHQRPGSEVLELAVIPTDKGQAVERLRHLVGASAVLFVGDDLSDEDAFRTLTGPDMGIKVGGEPSVAAHRVADPAAVAQLLAQLWELRQDWLLGSDAVPIERHTLLSDQRLVALVTNDGDLTWMPWPHVDSAGLFSALLGPGAGHFSIRPTSGARPISHRYVGRSMVVETRWPGLTLLDYFDMADGPPATHSTLVRTLQGRGEVDIEFAPRADFGRAPTALLPGDDDSLALLGTTEPLVLHCPGARWSIVTEGVHQTARARVTLDGSTPLVLELRLGSHDTGSPARDESERRVRTTEHWTTWASALRLPMFRSASVERSALTIKGLTVAATGALLAAATTSLPEVLGGVRNWDYRFCWIRDASLGATTLARLGSLAEGLALTEWMETIVRALPSPEQLRPLYTVDGRALSPEAVISELSGYAGSRPVRVGNAADHQLQLDVFGPVADLLYALDEQGAPLGANQLDLLDAMVQAVAARWHEPDNGIWEFRTAPRHFVHSKVMCWMTVDRAVRIRERRGEQVPTEWAVLRQAIRDDVLARGWNEARQTFTAAYDHEELDAAVLHIGLSGLVAGDDPRWLATIHAVETELRHGPIVYRYHADDGLPGREGGFLLCSFWLVQAYVSCGRPDDAVDLFDALLALAGPSGMLAEEYDPVTRRILGNTPQLYSHHGVIEAALTIERAQIERAQIERATPTQAVT